MARTVVRPATTIPVERTLAARREKYQSEVDRLVDAAVAVMRDRGTADPTVNDILAEAGLSTTAFYRHFPTKDDLFLTLMLHAGETCRAHVEHRMEAVTDHAAGSRCRSSPCSTWSARQPRWRPTARSSWPTSA